MKRSNGKVPIITDEEELNKVIYEIANEGGKALGIQTGIGDGGGIGYTSIKHVVIGFTKQLNADYGLHGIRANAIAPELIKIPMI
ncbi:hypothetical protein GCM10022217_10580 [Chryseobacterium ginsenosidimutans]|uniref:SDR family NAD(P)-dependent oxidoreductase n=1 Tax=Chryseobacterium ginsenosidimutans TaxID=687846 RepID=UPI0031E07052